VTLENESGRKGAVWVAQSRQHLDEMISCRFSEWRRLKQAAESEGGATRQASLAAAKAASQEAWALRNRYANIRHAYALTIHKSQGSTFDAVLIDWGSLPNNGGADASRLAYVAITRPSTYAVIVTP
jgi:exodeoxyribonuclease-5